VTSNDPSDAARTRSDRRALSAVFWIAFVLFGSLSAAWALASPIFSVPDENAHAVKAIAQVRGELIGHRVDGVRHLVMDVPPSYSYSPQIICFVYQAARPASCGVELGSPGGTDAVATWVSAYNPIYYYLVGWPSLLFGGSAGIYAMRIVSGLVGALFFAWAAQSMLASRRARWMPAALAFAAAPMVLYLNGAINPNGIEIVAGVALFASLLRLLQSFDGDRFERPLLPHWYLWLIASLSAVMLANARALGPLWVVVVVAICVIAVGWSSVVRMFTERSSYPWIAGIAIGGLFSVIWTLGGGSLSGQAEKADAPLVGGSIVQGVIYMVRATPNFLTQALGYFGWFDTPLPQTVLWPMIAAIAVILVLAFASARRRGVITLTAAAAAALLVPIAVQAYSVHQTGIIWQGRYGLFLYVGLFVVAGWVLARPGGDRVSFMSVRVTWIVAALIWTVSVAAYVAVLRRYVIGDAVPIGGMFKDPQWQPPLGWIALVAIFAVLSAAYFVWIGLLARRVSVRSEAVGLDESHTVTAAMR